MNGFEAAAGRMRSAFTLQDGSTRWPSAEIHVICCQPRVHPLTVQITRKLWIVRAKNACGNRIKGLNNCYRNF